MSRSSLARVRGKASILTMVDKDTEFAGDVQVSAKRHDAFRIRTEHVKHDMSPQ